MMEMDVASGSLCLSVVIAWMRVMGKLKKRLVQVESRKTAMYSRL